MSSEKTAESDYDKIIEDEVAAWFTGGISVETLCHRCLERLDKQRSEEREKEREDLREAIIEIPTRTEAPDNQCPKCGKMLEAEWLKVNIHFISKHFDEWLHAFTSVKA